MSHAKRTVEWCLEKAEREGARHRGLRRIDPDRALAERHVVKAEHNLGAARAFARIDYADWSAPAVFYATYHCLLALLAARGLESRNQSCTFAAVRALIEDERIVFDPALLERIAAAPAGIEDRSTLVSVREAFQYGIRLSLETEQLDELVSFARLVIDATKRELA